MARQVAAEYSESISKSPGHDWRRIAGHSLRHFLADLPSLNERFGGGYPRMIVRGEGVYLYDDHDHRVLDAGNHLGACQIGHGRREIGERIAEQVATLEFASLDSGASHPYATALAERLCGLAPLNDPVVSFTGSGSESNELAIKIARAYHGRNHEQRRTKVLCRDGSYHGSSYGSMSATGLPAFREEFGPLVPGFVRITQPSPGRCDQCTLEGECDLRCARSLEDAILREGPETVAAFIAEPVAILQAVKVPAPGYWQAVQDICRRYGVLLIIDEVVTGFGRTGRMFACEHWGIEPDLITVAKGLTSGYIPMGAVISSRQVESVFAGDPLVHLNTFAGHPVAAVAAMAVLDIIEREGLVERADEAGKLIRSELETMRRVSSRTWRISALGMLSSVEIDIRNLENSAAELLRVRHETYERGVAIRASCDDRTLTVVFYPPLITTDAQIIEGIQVLGEVLSEI